MKCFLTAEEAKDIREIAENLRKEDPAGAGKPEADLEEIKALTGAFGNSTQQEKLSSLAQTSRPGRFKDILE